MAREVQGEIYRRRIGVVPIGREEIDGRRFFFSVYIAGEPSESDAGSRCSLKFRGFFLENGIPILDVMRLREVFVGIFLPLSDFRV